MSGCGTFQHALRFPVAEYAWPLVKQHPVQGPIYIVQNYKIIKLHSHTQLSVY